MIALRYVGAVLIGMLVGGLVIGAFELVGALLFPLSDNMTAKQFEALPYSEKRELLHAAPAVAFLPMLLGYGVGMLVSGSITTLLWPARKRTGTIILALLMIAINAGNVWVIPQPLWVTVASFVILVLAIVAGGLLAARRGVPVIGNATKM